MSPSVSAVIPVFNGALELAQCLESLRCSACPPLECIVVDDGSTDDSAAVAARYGAKVLSTNGRRGPAYARNMGARAASSEILLFLDADVCVHTDTVDQILATFERGSHVDAVMGSYDDTPSSQNFMSQYRNLMHHYVHQTGNREATTFWSGCGAIRKQVFLEAGGFDESYSRAAIEDIDLGYRLSQKNRTLVLNPTVQVKHLKSWSLRSIIRTDVFLRALPWSELVLRTGHLPNDLNLRLSQCVSVVLVGTLIMIASLMAVLWRGYFLIPLFAAFFLMLSAYWIEAWSKRSELIRVVMTTLLVAIIVLSYLYHMLAIIPLVLLALIGLFARHRYAYAPEDRRRSTGILAGGFCLVSILGVLMYLPTHPLTLVFLSMMSALVLLNRSFYLFLAGSRGRTFALAVIPFHWLYYTYSGIAFGITLVRFAIFKLHSGAAGAVKTPKEAAPGENLPEEVSQGKARPAAP